MINSISICNFKLYREKTSFENFSSLNILTGINGRGKSTMMQSLLLPAQSLLISEWSNRIVLDGQFAKLGNMSDVKNEKATRNDSIIFEYVSDNGHLIIKCNSESDQSQELPVKEVIVDGHSYQDVDSFPLRGFVPVNSDKKMLALSDLLLSVRFIAAERVGPQLNYKPAGERKVMDSIGELAPAILYANKDNVIEDVALNGIVDIYPGFMRSDADDNTVNGILNFWLDKMFVGVSATADYVSNANVYVLNFNSKGNTKAMKPTNVGFGFSYVFPILVAGLTAKNGSILLIENPEAHLHPKAQSVLGKFLSWVSKYMGVQVFMETHSEHIVNSFRVLTAQSIIKSSDVNILFFDEALEGGFLKIHMDDDGHIESWPENFFDQEEKDLDVLL